MTEIDALLAELARPIVFVDLETTGGSASEDRITEIGLVEISREGVSTWSSLVDPQQAIPPFIERLTGITGAMVRGAPTFDTLAEPLARRLEGKLFAAHNARFDYGFLKSEFRRVGISFSADVLCTVRLSRALFPSEPRHGLDALIARHALQPSGRHRALSDADLLWQFWQKLPSLRPRAAIEAAVEQLVQSFSLPAAVDEAMLDALPTAPGTYVFYGEEDAALYVGKTGNLKQRVGAHFLREARPARDLKFARQVRRIETFETGGELGAALREAHLNELLQPQHNKRGKRGQSLCAWRLAEGAETPRLVHARDYDFATEPALFDLFLSRRDAQQALHAAAEQHGLCRVMLGLEPMREPGAGCLAYEHGACRGSCVEGGAESPQAHALRIRAALQPLRLKPWPYAGAIAICEVVRAPSRGMFAGMATVMSSGARVWHLIDRWRYLGSADTPQELAPLLRTCPVARFDAHTYSMLHERLADGSLLIETLTRQD
jgi:DNA polymerase-3 subunit epsilon